MNNQALRDKLFAALRGDALPHLRELDDIVLADIDRIMPIVEAHWEAEKLAWAEVLDSSITLNNSRKRVINPWETRYGPS